MTAFANTAAARKGELGEQFGEHFLRSIGYEVYKPGGNGAHPFDRLAVRRSDRAAFIADMKTKPKRVKYPDTGIDMRHRDEYLGMSKQHNLECLLVFVDEDEGRVYGNFLSKLEQHKIVTVENIYQRANKLDYPRTEWTRESQSLAEIRYYPLISMREFGLLSDRQCEQLRELSGRSKQYQAAADHNERQSRLFK